MKRRFFPALLSSMLMLAKPALAIPAAAATPESLGAQWSRHFAGTPRFPNLQQDFPSLLVFDRSRCYQTVKAVVDQLDRYGSDFVRSRSDDARKAFESIQATIAGAGACAEPARRAYATASLRLLDPLAYNLTIMPRAQELEDQTSYVSLVLLGVTLANRGYVEFWDKPMSQDGEALLGAYDCARTRISLDPKMRPADLAATFVHELDHLFVDKTLSAQTLQEQFGAAGGAVNWERFFLADEMLAITHTAYLQKQLSLTEHRDARIGNVELPFSLDHPYQLDGDLSLYQKGGPIEKLVKLTGHPDVVNVGDAESQSYNFLIETVVEPGGARTDMGWKAPNLWWKIREPVETIRSVVSSAYLGDPNAVPEQRSPTEKQLLHPMPETFNIALAPLASWMVSFSMVEQFAIHPIDTWTTPMNLPVDTNGSHQGLVRFLVEPFLTELDRLDASFQGVSPVCQMYLEEITRGDVDRYLGVRYSKRASGSGTASAIRPCVSMREKL